MMNTDNSQAPVSRLFSYPIASGDMYYEVVNERVLCVRDDPVHGFHIWGEIPGCGVQSAVDLCQVFLEYAMTCSAGKARDQAMRDMEVFGKRLGKALAKHLQHDMTTEVAQHVGACALECVLEAMHAHFIIEQCGLEIHYVLDRCPLCSTSERTGLREVTLAHHGIHALCQNLIQTVEPDLAVHTPAEAQSEHIFSVSSLVNLANPA